MEIIHRCCAGLDVHKKTVVACARLITGDGEILAQSRSFGTTTADLLALADWLGARGVTHVAIESTGVSWKPVFHILEGHFEVLLVNAAAHQARPGPQDRRQGCRVDRAAAPVRPAGAQLHAAAADPRRAS